MGGPTRIRWLLALVLLLGAAAGFVLERNNRLLTQSNRWIAHTQEVSVHVEQLTGALWALESRARGYVLTGDTQLRKGAEEASVRARDELARIRSLTADNPRQQELAARVETALEAKIAFNDDVMSIRDREGLAGAARFVAQGRGVSTMSAVTGLVGAMRAEEERLLVERTARSASLRRRTTVYGVFAMALLAFAIAAFAALVRSDIRERRAAETRTRHSEERFRMLLGAVRDYAIIMLDPDGMVEAWNGAAERIFGYRAEQIIGQHVSRFLPPGSDPRRELTEAAGAGRFEEQAPRVRADGTVFFADVVVTAIREGDELRGFAKIVRDVSERKALDDALRDTAEKLAASNRELQDFAMVASHDLQEPLRKVQMFGDKLKRRYGDALGEEGKDWLDRMQNAGARGQALIQGLLAFSRITTRAQPKVAVDLASTARDVVSDLEARIAGTSGRVEIGPLPVVEADPLQMRQLLQNLIGNALKFRKPSEPPVVRVDGQRLDGHGVRIEVSDNGIGFDPKYTDRIFKLFQRLHERNAYEGSGMGLAICRKIVERHGGAISARSAPGHGTTFVIDLPTQRG